jgi:quinoprotein glucose dehydrogenase
VEIPNAGGTGFSIQMVAGDLLLQTTEDLRGNTEVNENGMPLLHARDKRTGEILASVELPRPGLYGMMTFMHEGRQYIVVQSGSAKRGQPGALVALRLP